MSFHGNSKKNNRDHHLYTIHDSEENDIFKYGISDKPIGEDGYSRRMREQVDYLNRAVGWLRKTAAFSISVVPDLPSGIGFLIARMLVEVESFAAALLEVKDMVIFEIREFGTNR